MKRKRFRDELLEEAERLNDALKAFFTAVCKALYIDRIVEWLSKHLPK